MRPSGGDQHIHISAEGCEGFGVVSTLYPTGYLMVQNSCFEVDKVRALGNMSGGPALDKQGRIVGVISSSMDQHCHTIVSDWSALLYPAVQGATQTSGLMEIAAEDWRVRFQIDKN